MLAFLVALAVTVGVMFAEVQSEVVGISAIGLLLVLMFAKVPVAVALAVPGVVGLYALHGERALMNVLASVPYEAASQWTLNVIPMFVLMGMLLWKSGISTRLYTAGRQWLSWLPGGLGVATSTAGTALAAVSGSSIATTYTLARIGIPEMLKAGYHRRLALGSVAAASLPGHLIPPSILLIVYAGVAGTPVGPQLMAGVGPGLLIGLSCGLLIAVLVTVRPSLGGRERRAARGGSSFDESISWSQRWRSAVSVWPVPVLIVVVLGSLYSGVFTATEAGAAGAFGALLLTLWYQRSNNPVRVLASAVNETVRSVGAIFFLVIGAFIFARLISVTGLSSTFAELIVDLGTGRLSFLLLLVVGYLILGMFMDPLALILLTVPIFIPSIEALGISPLWFGVFVVLMASLAIVTPPVGILAFIMHNITKDPAVNQGHNISVGDVFRGVSWFLPIVIMAVLVLIAFPQIVNYLPSRM